jgi:glutaredoxin
MLVSPVMAESPALELDIYLFQSNSCSHCTEEKAFLKEIATKYPGLVINSYEVSGNPQNLQLMIKVGEKLGVEAGGVPFLIIGNESIIGFNSEETTGVQIEKKIEEGLQNSPEDIVKQVIAENPELNTVKTYLTPDGTAKEKPVEKKSPFKFDLQALPLPLFTFVIALMDGFNPCAMWALLFLISLLLGMKDRKKMWLLGGTFIVTSGLVYFLFLSAWLNFFMVMGYALVVRYIVGIFAFGLGVYYLYDFYKNRGGCVVSENEKRRGFIERLKEIVLNKHLSIALLGMVVLAASVNLIELLCSAGLPAVYTKVLSMNNLPVWQYYLYLVFYILIFMLDDIIVFVGAMITLQAFGIKNKYAKYSHLVGGIIVLLIGLALIFKPELLSFK